MKKKTALITALLLTASAVLSACSGKPAAQAAPASTAAETKAAAAETKAAAAETKAAETTAAEAADPYASWPEKDIRIIFNAKAGSSGDTLLRNLAAAMESKLNGHQIIVENIVDPTGAAAFSEVQKADPDGYTLTLLSSVVVQAELISNSPINYNDFSYINGMGIDPQYIYCRSEAPYNTLSELVEYAKQNPGKVNWGTGLPTGASTVCSVQIINGAGLDVNRVTYDGGSDILAAVLGGFVDIGVCEYGDVRAQVEAGQLKLLAVVSAERSDVSEIPTTVEEGYNLVFYRARGLAGPAGMDPALVQHIYELFKYSFEDKGFNDYMDSVCIKKIYMTGDELKATYDNIYKIISDNKDDILGTAK